MMKSYFFESIDSLFSQLCPFDKMLLFSYNDLDNLNDYLRDWLAFATPIIFYSKRWYFFYLFWSYCSYFSFID